MLRKTSDDLCDEYGLRVLEEKTCKSGINFENFYKKSIRDSDYYKFAKEDLIKNFATLADAIIKAKPSAAKGTYIKSAYLTTTMGPGIKLDSKNIATEIKEYVG